MSRYEAFMARSLKLKHSLIIKKSGDHIIFQASKKKFIRSSVLYTDSYYTNNEATYYNYDIDGYKMPNFNVDIKCEHNFLSQKYFWTNLNVYNFSREVVNKHSKNYIAVFKVLGKRLVKKFYKVSGANRERLERLFVANLCSLVKTNIKTKLKETLNIPFIYVL